MSKGWKLLKEKPVQDSDNNDVYQLLYWPHEESGGNREGEHWVRRLKKMENYETGVDNCYYWGSDARERALSDFNGRT